MKIHFSSFSRLVHEAIMINRVSNADNTSIMNSKREYGRTYLPRFDENKYKAETEAEAKSLGKASKARSKKGDSYSDSIIQLDSQSSISNLNVPTNNDRSNQINVGSKPKYSVLSAL